MKTQSRYKTRSRRGYTLLELLMVLAIVSTVSAVGYFCASGITSSVRSGKLQSDVVTLNNAVRTYLTNGGVIPAAADGQQVINRLKSISNSATHKRLAGIKGSMIDLRLHGNPINTPGPERAVWNATRLRFEVKDKGLGFVSFDLSDDPTPPELEEYRFRTLDLATKDNWVWDSGEAAMAKIAPRQALTAKVDNIEPATPSAITKLAAPDFSIPGALYDYSAFNPTLKVSLVDRNVPGEAKVFYSIDNGPWLEYGGAPLNIPPELTTKVRAYAAAVNGEFYEDSSLITQTYETIYFTGKSSGNFHSPRGDPHLLSNLTAGLKSPNFKWGDPATADKKQNELNFVGDSFRNIAPDMEFKLGTLTYYNGTTYAGTNATSVEVAIDLDLTSPGIKESLNFTFKLLSTPNYGKNNDADADYVYIPDVSTNFRTTIKGQTFALILRFGDHGPNGFTTIDTFHAHEGKTLRGAIYGRFSAAALP